MALRGLAGSEPSSRGPLEEVVAAAEEREAPALVAAAAALEDDEEDNGRGLLRWDGFSAWLHCVCVVGFDLELGQAVEVRPGHSHVPLPCPGPRLGGPSRVCGPRASGSSKRASGRGWPPLLPVDRAAVYWQFPWEDLGLRLGVKSSLKAPPKYLLIFFLNSVSPE